MEGFWASDKCRRRAVSETFALLNYRLIRSWAKEGKSKTDLRSHDSIRHLKERLDGVPVTVSRRSSSVRLFTLASGSASPHPKQSGRLPAEPSPMFFLSLRAIAEALLLLKAVLGDQTVDDTWGTQGLKEPIGRIRQRAGSVFPPGLWQHTSPGINRGLVHRRVGVTDPDPSPINNYVYN